jgi:hypothetical protein
MSMVWANTGPALLRRLKRYGGFTSDEALARFYTAVINGCNMIRRGKEWDWKNSQADIATTGGSTGPYDAPASFYRMALSRKVYLYGYSDTLGQILAPVLDSDSDRWDVIYRVSDGKLYFRKDPGTGTVTFNFVATIDDNPTEANAQLLVEAMPGNLSDILADFVEADFLDESPDTKADSIAMLNKATAKLEAEYSEFLKGKPAQRQRSPRGMDGYPLDGLGQQTSIQKPNYGRFPRGRGYR